MKEILTALMIWLGANTQFDTNHDIPVVVFLPQETMEQMFYGDNKYEPDSLHGMYHRDTDTIYLPDTWDRRGPWDLSVLLHEMVHYVQDQNNIVFTCTQEMEKDSWLIQQKYLLEVHKVKWNYDKLWHLMVSSCSDFFNY
jgi:hypothetical protein